MITARSQLNHGWLWPFWSPWAHGEQSRWPNFFLWVIMGQNWLPGGCLNIKIRRFLTRESTYLGKTVFILRWGPQIPTNISVIIVISQMKHYHQNILGCPSENKWDFQLGIRMCLSQTMARNSGNGQIMQGICWEFWWNMQLRFTGTKCLIRHWEYFPV